MYAARLVYRTLNCVDTPRVPNPVGVFSRFSHILYRAVSMVHLSSRSKFQLSVFRCMREQSDKLIECLRRSLTGAELAVFLK